MEKLAANTTFVTAKRKAMLHFMSHMRQGRQAVGSRDPRASAPPSQVFQHYVANSTASTKN